MAECNLFENVPKNSFHKETLTNKKEPFCTLSAPAVETGCCWFWCEIMTTFTPGPDMYTILQVEFCRNIDPKIITHWAALSIEKDWFPRATKQSPNFAKGSKIFSTDPGRAATSPARDAPWFAGTFKTVLYLKYEQDVQFCFPWLCGNLIFSHYRGRRKVLKKLSEDAGRTYWCGLKDNNLFIKQQSQIQLIQSRVRSSPVTSSWYTKKSNKLN